MQQRQRLKALDRFKRASETPGTGAALIATDVAARGLDVEGVRTVIHYQVGDAGGGHFQCIPLFPLSFSFSSVDDAQRQGRFPFFCNSCKYCGRGPLTGGVRRGADCIGSRTL